MYRPPPPPPEEPPQETGRENTRAMQEVIRRETIIYYFNEYKNSLELTSISQDLNTEEQSVKDRHDYGVELAIVNLIEMETLDIVKEKLLIDGDHHNILSLAIKYLSLELVEYILENNLLGEGNESKSVDARTGRERTPLMVACDEYGSRRGDREYNDVEEKRKSIIELLLRHGPRDTRTDVKDRDNRDFRWYVENTPDFPDDTKRLLGIEVVERPESGSKPKKHSRKRGKSKKRGKGTKRGQSSKRGKGTKRGKDTKRGKTKRGRRTNKH